MASVELSAKLPSGNGTDYGTDHSDGINMVRVSRWIFFPSASLF